MTIHAFPSGHNPKTGMIEHGMTLRDYFAAKAMQSLLIIKIPEQDLSLYTDAAYDIADAMMKARDD